MSEKDLVLRVAAKGLIVNHKGHVLILREAGTYKDGTNIGRYHLPGGRLEVGEAFNDGLMREVKEETGLEVEPLKPLFVGEWRPVIRDIPHQIIALYMACLAKSNSVALSDEHDHFEWIKPQDHVKFDLMTPEDKVIQAWQNSL